MSALASHIHSRATLDAQRKDRHRSPISSRTPTDQQTSVSMPIMPSRTLDRLRTAQITAQKMAFLRGSDARSLWLNVAPTQPAWARTGSAGSNDTTPSDHRGPAPSRSASHPQWADRQLVKKAHRASNTETVGITSPHCLMNNTLKARRGRLRGGPARLVVMLTPRRHPGMHLQ